jgi:hypothetical protein
MALEVSGGLEYLDAQLTYHLNAGVDLVIATAPADPATSEILDLYAGEGYLVRVVETDGTPVELRARTAELAATEHAGDWLFAATPREFWWPRGAHLRDVLVAVPPRYGVVQALTREFLPRAGTAHFAERMIVRDSLANASAGDEPLAHLLRPIQRLVPGVGVHGGQPLRAWYPIEVMRFPQDAETSASDVVVAAGSEDGSLVVDERLRNALSQLREGSGYRLPGRGEPISFPAPTVVDDAQYAVECAAVGEVNLDRLDQQIRELEDRIAVLEQGLWRRATRRASRLAPGRLRRRS